MKTLPDTLIEINTPPADWQVQEVDAKRYIERAWRMVGASFPIAIPEPPKRQDHEDHQPIRR